MARRFGRHSAIAGWLVSNEMPIYGGPAATDDVTAWARAMVQAVRSTGAPQPVAVKNVCFEVAPGEVVALIGESGSGKSTIGKMILRLLRPSAGLITFRGVDIATLEGRKLKEYYGEVQAVFQDPFSSYNPIFKCDRVHPYTQMLLGAVPQLHARWQADGTPLTVD